MIAVIDNYDSFTYNLVQYLQILGLKVEVFRNDVISVEALDALNPDGILISPGPGVPEVAGISIDVVRRLGSRIPTLGVCLGHQAIVSAFGGTIVSADRLMHGRTSKIEHDGSGVFRDIPNGYTATRYHSLIVDADALPEGIVATAWSEQRELMGVRHRIHPIEGVQFHPESFLTEHGQTLLRNFVSGRIGGRA